MLKRVSAILWRKCNKATFDSLNDLSDGQYDIRLTKNDYEHFFLALPPVDQTDLGGYSLYVPLEPFVGPQAVAATEIKVRFMGEKSGRKDWNIPSQRRATAYALWRQGRGVSKAFNEKAQEFMLIIRDIDGKFHARWIHDRDFTALPLAVQQVLNSKEAGWKNLV
jgi:5-methylcytosine-specific restriction protein B